MNPIYAALESGYSPQKILNYLKKIDPDLALKINTALQAGYPIEQVLSFLSKNGKKISNLLGDSGKENKNIYQQASRGIHPSLKQFGTLAAITGVGALGAASLTPQVAKSIIPEVLGSIQPPSLPQKESVEIDLTPKIASQQKQLDFQPPNQLIQQAKEPQVPPIAPTPSTPAQPQMPQVDFGQILDQLGVKNKVDALRENNPPDVIAKVVRYGLPKEQVRQLESQFPLDQVISGYLQTAPAPENMQQKIAKGADFSRSRSDNISQEKEIGSSVLLPDGQIGEIESIKQGIAKVKVGDKIRNKKLNELMQSPKEAAVAALELIKSFTPEHLRSAHHALNMYDPTTRSAQFLFHNGEGYIIENISPEEYERLSNELDAAKTTGETKIGAWATGTGSRGAAYQKIVKNLNKPYRKIMVGYNLFKEFQRLISEKEE